jgi:membrane-associated phospholipid phosphatase
MPGARPGLTRNCSSESLVRPARLMNLHPLRNWGLGLLATATAVAIAYFWLDRPIALLAHDVSQRFHLFQKLTLIPDALLPIAVVVILLVGLRGLIGVPLSRFETVLFVAGISLAIAAMAKAELKIAFGRTWPETWIRNNPSLIRDHVYGFFPFHGGGGYASFPSGHTTIVCAMMTVFWICYPRLRPLYALAMAGVAIGLVGANFHFLSDVIAGAFLGISVGWISVALWESGTRWVRKDASATHLEPPR